MFASRARRIPLPVAASYIVKIVAANKPLLAGTAKWAVRLVPWMRKFHLSEGTKVGQLKKEMPTVTRHARKLYISAGLGATTCFTLLVASSLEYFKPIDGVEGRYRLMIYSPEKERLLGHEACGILMEQNAEKILPDDHPLTLIVKRVVFQLLKNIDQLPDPQPTWRVHIVDSFDVNAFVVPSGDIFVYLGMLEAAQNETCVAAVLGHELSHVVARHTVESLSTNDVLSIPMNFLYSVLLAGSWFWSSYLNPVMSKAAMSLYKVVVSLPFSRDMEIEADRLGMILIHRSGYDVHKAANLWKYVEEHTQKSKGSSARCAAHEEFFSTHPCHQRRLEEQQEFAARLAPEPHALPLQKLTAAVITAPVFALMRLVGLRDQSKWTFEEWSSHLRTKRLECLRQQQKRERRSTDVVFIEPRR